MKSNKEIRQFARQELKGYWTMPVLATFVFMFITLLCGAPNMLAAVGSLKFRIAMQSTNLLFAIFVTVPLSYGLNLAFLGFLREDKEDTVPQMFAGFKAYGRAISVVLLTYIYTVLWTLLLFIPGIIKISPTP